MRSLLLLLLCVLIFLANVVSSFIPASKLSRATRISAEEPGEILPPTPTNNVVKKVAVAGATGRTGRLVVEELLSRDVQVKAMVRSLEKAKETFPVERSDLEILKCDLTSEADIKEVLMNCDAVIWCATGFSDAPTRFLERFKRLLGIALSPKTSIDSVGIPAIARCMRGKSLETGKACPTVVMLSSAGVTRPKWDETKKDKFSGCADIPIVRLNPFGILDIKADSEEKLRHAGVNYCIVRPAGLNDKWPSGVRPVFSQGDVAVGRINRKDVASVLVDVLSTPEASSKTFEIVGLAGYPPARSIAPALERLKKDSEDLTPGELYATFSVMQQLLPGERQDASSLAMGQTYEQLDAGETGRLGERGKENAEAAAPKPTSS